MDKRKRSVADYVVCAVGVLFILAYASAAFQPVTVEHSEPEPVIEVQAQEGPDQEEEAVEPELSDMAVMFIDVGQGDAELLELPDGKVMLIDSGEALASRDVLDALKSADVDKIDYLVASCVYADHIGGMEAVLNAYDVGEVWVPEVSDMNDVYADFLDAVDEKGLAIETAEEGAKIGPDDMGYSVDILAPTDDADSEDTSDHSAIVKVTYGDTTFLFTGDASAKEIVDANPGHVDVLKAAGHGSEIGTNAEVATETTPTYIVISYAEGNSYGYPEQSMLDVSSTANSTVFSTAANGNVTVMSDGETVTVETEKSGQIAAGVSAEERERQEAEAQAQAQAEVEAQARQQQQEEMVVVTQTGEKYHRPGCRTLSRSKNTSTVTKSEAEAMGLGPCGVCNP